MLRNMSISQGTLEGHDRGNSSNTYAYRCKQSGIYGFYYTSSGAKGNDTYDKSTWHESCSGSIDDLAHVTTTEQMADVLTKEKAPMEFLQKAVNTGFLPNCDKHLPFREMMKNKHKAFFITWLTRNLRYEVLHQAETFLGYAVANDIQQCLAGWPQF